MNIRTPLRRVYSELSRQSAGRGSTQRALYWFQKMKAIAPLQLHEEAYEATLILINGDYNKAENIFERLRDLGDIGDGEQQYVRAYCRFMLADILGNVDDAYKARAEALSISTHPTVRRFLPL